MNSVLALGFSAANSSNITIAQNEKAVIAIISDVALPADYVAPIYMTSIEGSRPIRVGELSPNQQFKVIDFPGVFYCTRRELPSRMSDELLTDPTFDDGYTYWPTLGTDWTIADGEAVYVYDEENTGTLRAVLTNDQSVVPGNIYELRYAVTANTDVEELLLYGDLGMPTIEGAHIFRFDATELRSGSTLDIQIAGGSTLTLSSVSLKRVYADVNVGFAAAGPA